MDAVKLVMVRWTDTAGLHGWASREERLRDTGLAECVTVGFVLEDNDQYLTVAESLSDDDHVGCTSSIPKSAITAVETLREVPAP